MREEMVIHLWSRAAEGWAKAPPADWRFAVLEPEPGALAIPGGGVLLVPQDAPPPPAPATLGQPWVYLTAGETGLEEHGDGWARIIMPEHQLIRCLPAVLPLARALHGSLAATCDGPGLGDIMAHLGHLLRVAGTFRVADSMEGLYERLTDQLCDRFPFSRALLFLKEPGGRFRLRSLSWPGGDAEGLARALAAHTPELKANSPEYEAFTLGRALPAALADSGFFGPESVGLLAPVNEVAMVPLFTDRDFVGVVVADFVDQPQRALGEAELALLEAYATLVGSLLFSRRLFAELESKNRELRLRIREMSLVADVTRIIARSAEAHTVIDEILKRVGEALEADFGFVYLYDHDEHTLELRGSLGLDQDTVSVQTMVKAVDEARLREDAAGLGLVTGGGPVIMRVLEGPRGMLGLWGMGRLPGAEGFNAGEKAIMATVHQHAEVAGNSLRMQRLATTDALTGLYSRGHFREALEQGLQVSRYLYQPLSLILVDLDHFKDINDTFGHQAGDQVLIAVAGMLGEGRRNGDVCARWGGDEMAMVLPGCSGNSAIKLAEGLRRRCRGMVVEYKGRTITCSVSMGVATAAPEDQVEAEELLGQADRALYQAKEAGRDAVVLHPGGVPPQS